MILKNFILFFLAIVLGCLDVHAQPRGTKPQQMNLTRVNQLLDKYLSEKSAGQGGETALTGLSVYFGGLSDTQKKYVCKSLMDRIEKSYSSNNMGDVLLLSDLYESFSPDASDPNFARLFYIRGEYAASESDTLALKKQIQNIESCVGDKKEQYLAALYKNLEEIRNYVPVDRTIDGVWVSNLKNLDFNLPYFMLEVKSASNGIPVFTLKNKTGFLDWLEKPVSTQEEFAFTNDSIYVVFSNEDLKQPSPFLNEILRTSGNTYSTIVGMKTAMSTGSSILGDISGRAMSMAVDAVANSIFAPRKYSYLLEIKFRKVNDWQMEADVALHDVKVKGDNEPKYGNREYHTLFTKIKSEDNWYWYDEHGNILTMLEQSGKEYDVFKKEHKCPVGWYMHGWSNPQKTIGYFNWFQTAKMEYLTEERLIREGVTISDSVNWHNKELQPMLGVKFEENSSVLKISKVATAYPAERAGIEKGDVVTHIDGYQITTVQQFYDLINSKRPCDKVVITLLRKNKKRDIAVELAFLPK